MAAKPFNKQPHDSDVGRTPPEAVEQGSTLPTPPLERLRVSSAQSTGDDNAEGPSSAMVARGDGCQPSGRDQQEAISEELRHSKLTSSYDLLCEDDPDDFVTLEMPADTMTTDSDVTPPELDMRRKGRFLDNLRRNRNTMTNTTVITGNKRVRGRGRDSRAKGEISGSPAGVALHDFDDPRVVQETHLEAADRVGGLAPRNHGVFEPVADRWSPSQEDKQGGTRTRNRSNDLIPSDHQYSPNSKKQAAQGEAAADSTTAPARENLTAKLSESHMISHQHNQQFVGPGQGAVAVADKEEEFRGFTAGIGLGKPGSHSPLFSEVDPSLSSDMLMSMNFQGPEMSVQPSLHIGLAARDLQISRFELPSDEETAKEASRARIDSMESDTREFADEDVESATWCEHQKHVFVLSLSGKPVYSRYGKEDKLVNLFGIMQALVSFIQDDRDNLRSIVAGGHKFVFVCRGPLVLVSVAQTTQSETQLAIQLNYVYNQILSVLTYTQLFQIFEKMPGYDLRYLLQGSEKFVDNVLNMIDKDPSFIIGGVRCLAMSVSLRQMITGILMQCRTKDVLFAVMVVNNQVVTYVKPREHNLVPVDIHLILNLVDASTSFKSAESWTPICLPKFNDTGFLHAHVSYLPNDSPACLLLLSANKEKFFEMQECQQRIIEKLDKQGCIGMIKDAVKESCYSTEHLQAPEIRHFLYKSRKTSCVTSPRIPPMYSEPEDESRLYSLYMFMHEVLHSRTWPTKILYHVGNKEALLGWRTAAFDLYLVFDPLINKAQAILLGNKLIKWINKDEDRLIITSTHTF